MSEVLKRTGYSKAWVYALMSRGQFPQSVKIGARAIAFIESEIDDWIDQRIAESRSNKEQKQTGYKQYVIRY
ncbi:helix-turn-helix transcriptional regulator [Escherichia coli]|uniref:helix-turn-helix transcriptional regulator n=1 Tax=Escherichia coli TaxID=562 RepID=UPI000B7F9701|nr:AlpA family transcriptional regulator [Escherichia coli]MBC1005837.1 AlpA family transcriptional regulator [Escherichia coli]MBZ2285966.1 AlpA family transcriptional regulator [Escherichia coli]HDW0472828.1 AlpA family transcriptional regulator [Escherichia coli]